MATIKEALELALKYHQAGQLDAAAQIYQEILAHESRQADAWHLLGLVNYSRGQHAEAIDHIGRAIALDESQASFHNHLAEAYLSSGRTAEAEASCRKALSLNPDYAIGHNTLGTVLAARGAAAEAMDAYRRAIELSPRFAQAHCNLALALEEQGKLSDAEAAYRRALTEQPRYPTALFALAVLLQRQSRHAESIDLYRQLIRLQPQHSTGLCNLASALKDTNRPDEAIACYEKSLAIDPQLVEAHFGLGVIYQAKRQFDKASAAYRRAIALKPDYATAQNNLGTIYLDQGLLAEAIRSFEKTLETFPDSAEALSNLGNVFMTQGRRTDAMICYDQALRAKPDYGQAHTNRALARLSLGHFIDGWPEYEWRWQCPEFTPHGHCEPLWDGGPLGNRTLLVHAEQGLGDTLQFARYVLLVAASAGRVVFQAPNALVSLFEQSGFPGVVALGDPLPNCDLQIPLMSMPLAFGTTLDTVPRDVPYLAVDPQLVDRWRNVLAHKDKFKIAIAWQGSVTYRSDRYRSIPLRHFAHLVGDGVQLISVQKGDGANQIAEVAGDWPLLDVSRELDDFHQTAAVLKNVNLVITCDTSVAHLAGALGVPTWVALPIGSDFRWLADRDDSPWYPTMRLFRQTTFNEWRDVFERIATALQETVKNSTRKR